MDIEDIRCRLVVGAGTMGQQIALQCAMHGYEVIVYDIEAAAKHSHGHHSWLSSRPR